MSDIKHLLPVVPKYYKSALHVHSNITDGAFSPAEVKELYKSRGYQVLCITDHNVIVDHSNLNEDGFLMLTGAEYNINEDGQTALYKKTYHLNCIAKRPDNLWQPMMPKRPMENSLPYLEKVHSDDMERRYDPDLINQVIARCNEKGFLVMYNHPIWSLQNYTDYAPLKGLWGMEICNYGGVSAGRDTYSTQVFRDLLALGNKIYPVGADDMHGMRALAGAWVMVGAESLTYDHVIRALEDGDFYASTGPEIHSLTLDGTTLTVTCSDAQSVSLSSDCRFAKLALPTQNDRLLREASFNLEKWIEASQNAGLTEEAYIRLTVTGPYGHKAFTRAYYLTELL